jgi:adenosylcobyric acid synthase
MILGCTSDAGKSFLAMALCRALSNRGMRVAPFKAQNMSNNAAVTADGLEIGRAQYAQALAARVEPDVRMNPVLIKPLSDVRGAVILNGRPAPEVEAVPWMERSQFTWPAVTRSLHSLIDEFDVVVIEGAGSPAEVNLRAADIVNMRVALEVGAHSYLCSDIDRGGSFAHLLGTWHCLAADEQALLKGFVLNKFRGDPLLLGDALGWLESKTGVSTVAVVPWIHHQLPEEDRLIVRNADLGAASLDSFVRIGIVLYPYASNTDEFDPLGSVEGVVVETIRNGGSLAEFDAVILPGSRNIAASIDWMRSVGIVAEISALVSRGGSVLGICGGMQILGHSVDDTCQVEGGDVVGLGLLGLTTELAVEKVTKLFYGKIKDTGEDVVGYEIHHGVTAIVAGSRATPIFDVAGPDVGWKQDCIVGVYAHALLEDANFRAWWLTTLRKHSISRIGSSPPASAAPAWAQQLEAEFDRVAQHLEATGFVDIVLAAV